MEEKCALLEEVGLDHLIVHPFTADVARMQPLEYVQKFFVEGIKPVAVIVGYDHRFGKNREGDLPTLIHLGASFGFTVEELPAYHVDETRVSSTKIRQAIAEGRVAEAATLLGDWYPVSGHVVSGQQIGRAIGFPTANLRVSSRLKLLPEVGVYAAWAEVEGERFAAMVNVGVRPTIESDSTEDKPKITVEAHFLDSAIDLYGMTIRLHFVKRIRDEQAFPGLDALKDQLRLDKVRATEILSAL
jgi:riboflavin kinase/FMN adenylyltransferase